MAWKHAVFSLDLTITVERNTPAADASGGMTMTWAPISADTTNIRASRHKAERKHNIEDMGRGQREGKGEYKWITEVDCGARPGDRINHGGTYYAIKDADNRGRGYGVESIVYEMWTDRIA